MVLLTLTLCKRCEKYMVPVPTLSYDGGGLVEGLVCEFCGWKVTRKEATR